MRSFFLALALTALIGTAEAQQSSQIAPPPSGSMLHGASIAATPIPADVRASDSYKALIADLRQGGYVIYLRHGMTGKASEATVGDFADCSWQRNLSDAGRRQAASVGRRLSEENILVAALEASPYCRTRQTAELAFGRVPKVNQDLFYHATQRAEQVAAANAKLKERLGERPPPGGNLVLIGHSPAMKDAAAVELSEGEGVIVKPNGDGTFRIVAQLTEAGIMPIP
ncbi:MAG: histidine phosphatase family protein [Reyranella sp.]